MLYAGQRLGVSHKQIPSRIETSAQALYNILLRAFVEIHHYVPAENHVEEFPVRKGLYQIEPLKSYPANELRLELEEPLTLAVPAQKISFQPGIRQVAEAIHRVYSALCDSKHPGGDVGGQDVEAAPAAARPCQSVG